MNIYKHTYMLCDISNVAVLHRFTTTFPTTLAGKIE